MERLDFSHARYRSRVNDLFLSPFVPHVPELPELDDWEEVTPTQLYVSPSGCTTLSYLSIAQCIHLSRDFIEGIYPNRYSFSLSLRPLLPAPPPPLLPSSLSFLLSPRSLPRPLSLPLFSRIHYHQQLINFYKPL